MKHQATSTSNNYSPKNSPIKKQQKCCAANTQLRTILCLFVLSFVWFRHQLLINLVKQQVATNNNDNDNTSPYLFSAVDASVVSIPRPEAIYGSSESGTSPVEDMDDDDDTMGADASDSYGAAEEPEDDNGESSHLK